MKKRLLWAGLAVGIALPLAAPFYKADQYAPGLAASLERALQRRVEVGEVRLHLLTGPGFTLSDVVIHEDPAVSAEPLAYVTSMVVRLRVLALLQGRLEFSALRLEEPSLNLMQLPGGAWNVQALLRSSTQATGGELPDLEVRGGRLNFKLANTKSAYYLTGADIDFSAEAGGRAFDLWFRAEPARTDRPAQGFGRFTGRGRWLRPESGEPRLEMDYQLEPSAVEELAKLLASRDLGLHGMVESKGRLAGPISAMELTGRLDLNDLHYWSQPPRPGQWRVGYKGKWNLVSEEFRLATEATKDSPLPFRASVDLQSYLSAPRWQVELHPEEMPLALAVGWMRPAGERFRDLQVEGKLSGSVLMAQDRTASGSLAVTGFALVQGGEKVVRSESFPVEIGEGKLKLNASAVEFGAKGLGALDYEWNWVGREVAGQLQAKPLGVDQIQLLAALWGEKPPLLDELEGGQVRGQVRVRRSEDGEAEWAGSFGLSDSRVKVPELAEPVELIQAGVEIKGERLAARGVKARVGKVAWEGEYRYETGQPRPHRFEVRLGRTQGAELERLLTPALQRESGFLARTLGIGEAKVPEWLASRRAEGTIKVAQLEVGQQTLENLRANVQWDASRVALRTLQFGWGGGEVSGDLAINLLRNKPEYRWEGKATGVSWQGGKVQGKWTAESRGMADELGRNSQAKGEVNGEQVTCGEQESKRVKAKFALRVEGGGLKIDLTGIEMETAEGVWTGKGSTQRDGKLAVELSSEGRELKLVGTAFPFEVR